VHNGEIFFQDATAIWGHTTWDAEVAIQKSLNDSNIRTLAIGPGGENLVRFACLIVDRGRAIGYGGAGAIFGSKNLKAVAVRGTLGLEVAHAQALMQEVKRYHDEVINQSGFAKIYRQGGTLLGYLGPKEKRPHAVRNMSDEFWPDQEIEKILQDKFDPRQKALRSCFGCPYHGSRIYEINHLKCEGIQANTWRAFASNLGITDPEKMLEIHAKANLNGLDGDHLSAVMAWAVECYENGIINRKETDGLELRWGNAEALSLLTDQITLQKGFGKLLGQGLSEATRILGRGSHKFATLSHKNALMEAGMRSHRAWALGILTSTKGGGHLRGAPAVEFKWTDSEKDETIFGLPGFSSGGSYQGKAALVVMFERYKAVVDMMGLCYLPSMWMDLSLFKPLQIASFYELATGRDLSVEALMSAGEKLQTSETIFNLIHANFGRADCLPPARLLEEPVSKGIFKGEKIDLGRFGSMLDEYYQFRDWDHVTGWPFKETALSYGLYDQVAALERTGRHLPEKNTPEQNKNQYSADLLT
jgi:aldehyde:ferredoxin oxidoreductase